MSVKVELMPLKSPNLSSLNRAFTSPPVQFCASPSLRFQHSHRRCRVLGLTRSVVSPVGIRSGSLSPDRRFSLNRSFVAFAASHEESQSEIQVEKEKGDLGPEGEESQEAWKQALASFKEQALRMQSVSQEAYNVQSEKAIAVLKETSEQLRIQAEKVKEDLSAIAKEIGEESREYISKATEDSPEDVKEIMEAFPSADDFDDISKTRDFHVGIPYGLLLFLGGFLSFMLTGSIPAIRFGVILGAALFVLSLASFRSHKKGESYTVLLKGQAAITAIIFLKEIHLLSQRSTLLSMLTTIVSGAVVAFYVYKMAVDGKKGRGSNLPRGTEN